MLTTKEFKDGSIEIKGKVPCDRCDGTGLYIGMAEKDGAAVVCYNCDGKGYTDIKEKFEPFVNRKNRKDVNRVYDTAGGYVISSKDVKTEEGLVIKFSEAGCTYKEWVAGETPKPIEDLMCPYQHTNQNLQSEDVNNLYKNYCEKYLGWGGYISKCKNRKNMCKCWEIYNG
jgi:hypothetical protein